MSAIITSDEWGGQSFPTLVQGIEFVSSSRTVTHDMLGEREPIISVQPHGASTAELRLLFTGPNARADAEAAEDMHKGSTRFNFEDNAAGIVFWYLVTGEIRRSVDPETPGVWQVQVSVTETSA